MIEHAPAQASKVSAVPLTMLSKWMGHAEIEASAIYANAGGPEEQHLAARMWSKK